MMEPRGRCDLTGWHELTCAQADVVFDRHKDLPGFEVASGFTDVDGLHGDLYLFREWWFQDAPLLRDYRYTDGTHCRHYGAMDISAARIAS